MSLKSLLSEARRKKQLQSPGNASHFNFDNAHSDSCPSLMWELSDVFSYSESFFFGKWQAAATARLAVEEAGKRETLEGLLRQLMGNTQTPAALAFFEPIVEHVSSGQGVYELSLSLNVLSFIMLRFPDSSQLKESIRTSHLVEVMLKYVVGFADAGDATVPIKKVMLVLWRAAVLGMGSNADIDARKAALVAAKRGPQTEGERRLKSRQCDLDDMKKRMERVQWTTGGAELPSALREAHQVLERSLHVPAAALRHEGPMDSRPLRKVVGYELRVSRECGSLATAPGQPKPPRRVNVSDKNALPFEAFYRRAVSRVSEYVLAIVKVLVAVLTESKTLDIMGETMFGSRKGDRDVQTHMDAVRQRAILGKTGFAVLLLLLRQARENHVMQYEHLLAVYGEYNVTLLLFRYLQQDINGMCLQKFYLPDARVHFGFVEPAEQPVVNWNAFVATVACLRLLHKLVKNSLGRVIEMMNAKMEKPLKKLLNCNPTVRTLSLKILKKTFRLCKGKKRLQEGALITQIYMELDANELNDDWLTNFYLEQDESIIAGEELVREAEGRAECCLWNGYHYRYREPREDVEYDATEYDVSSADECAAVVAAMLAQLEQSVQVQYPDNVVAWLDREVFKSASLSQEPFQRLFI